MVKLAYGGDRRFNGQVYEFYDQIFSGNKNTAEKRVKHIRGKGYLARLVWNETEKSWLIYIRKKSRRKK